MKKFCNRQCQFVGQRTNSSLICVVCGKSFYCSKSQQRERNRKTCSNPCKAKYLAIHFKGEGSPSWKGGISGENRSIRYSAFGQSWRKQIFERDNYTCQVCNVRGTYLEAHHIFRFAYFPDLRFNLWNGMTLCRPCHDKTKKHDRKLQLIRMDEIQEKESTV